MFELPGHKYKTFLSIYSLINTDLRAFKKSLKDKRLTNVEKKLLTNLHYLVKNELDIAIEELTNLRISDQFLNAYRNYFLGIALNHKGLYFEAAKVLVDSINHLNEYEDKLHVYRPVLTITSVYFNMRDLERLEKYYEVFLGFKNDSKEHEMLMYQYQIYINLLIGESEKCENLIKEASLKFPEYYKKNHSFYVLLRISANVQKENFIKCYEILKEYPTSSGVRVSANYKYIKVLLDFYTKDKPIYIYKSDFKDSEFLFLQLEFLQAMSLEEHDDALVFWNEMKAINPFLYGDDFEYKGDKNIFSICLEKVKQKSSVIMIKSDNIDISKLASMKSSYDKLDYIFSFNQYFSKYDLIEFIWNEDWTPENDTRLRMLISRYRKKRACNIDNTGGKYKKVS